jgi:hypothetical protein
VRKFVITFTTAIANITLAIVVGSVAAATVVYAQNATTTQQTNYNYTNATNTTIPPIKGPNASIIIDAINAKIRSIYGGGDEKTTNSVTGTTITKVGLEQTRQHLIQNYLQHKLK